MRSSPPPVKCFMSIFQQFAKYFTNSANNKRQLLKKCRNILLPYYKYGNRIMMIFQIIFSNMVISNMVIFSDIRKYGNMPYGNVFRNYYHISTSKYGKKKTYPPYDLSKIWTLLRGRAGRRAYLVFVQYLLKI